MLIYPGGYAEGWTETLYSYAYSSEYDVEPLEAQHPSGSGLYNSAFRQFFRIDEGTEFYVTSVQFLLSRTNFPTGTLKASILNSSSISIENSLAVDPSVVTTSSSGAWYNFNFSGETLVSAGSNFYVMIYVESDLTFDHSNIINVFYADATLGSETFSPGADPGVGYCYHNGWYALDDTIAFKVYGVGETTAPTFEEVTASTLSGSASITLNCTVNDPSNVSSYIYSWNNTGSWTNSSQTGFAVWKNSTAAYAVYSGTWSSTASVVSVKVYAEDVYGNWGVSDQYNFTLVHPAPTATIAPTVGPSSSGMWNALENFDLIAFFTIPLTAIFGQMAYFLILLAISGAFYFRYKNINIILFLFVIFGGVGGVLSAFLPAVVMLPLYAILAIGLAGLLFRLFR